MRLIACHNGKLLTTDSNAPSAGRVSAGRAFSSGLADLDAIAPGGAFARGAIHELLTHPADGQADFIAMLLAMGAGAAENPNPESRIPNDGITQHSCKLSFGFRHSDLFRPAVSGVELISDFRFRISSGVTLWCDPARELYPPALASYGFPLDQLYLLHPKSPDPAGKDLIWAATECLRCKGVSAVVAPVGRLSRIEARRLQLAAERGGSVGLLLRHVGRGSAQHAAASRWLVRPSPGSRTIQRWTIQLLHGHGGRIGQTLCLELCRETNHLRTFDPMADRQVAEKPVASIAS